MENGLLIIGAALLLLGRKRDTASANVPRENTEKNRVFSPSTSRPTDGDAMEFVRRANQKRARDWIPEFIAAGASPALAAGLARWAGIESSGNPIAVSPIGERGLLQITKTTALKEKALTPAEWDALISPNTTRAQHARLALKQFAYHVKRGRRWVANPPPEADVASWLYYAKAHHTRPGDMTADRFHGPGEPMHADLIFRHAGNRARLRRAYSAGAVAFGGVG